MRSEYASRMHPLGRAVVLQTVDGLVCVVDGPQRTIARLGRASVERGPHGLAIIDAFRQARTLDEGVSRLASHAGSAGAWAEMMAAVVRLYEARFLVSPGDSDKTAAAASSFASAAAHIRLLDDRTRTAAFLEAIQSASAPQSGQGRVTASDDGVIDGVLVSLEADLAPGVTLSTHPQAKRAAGSSRMPLLLAAEGVPVKQGESVVLSLTFGETPHVTIAR